MSASKAAVPWSSVMRERLLTASTNMEALGPKQPGMGSYAWKVLQQGTGGGTSGQSRKLDPTVPAESEGLEKLMSYYTANWQKFSEDFIHVSSAVKKDNEDPTTATVVFAHGLGDTGEGWASSFVPMAKAMPHVKFIFPTSLDRPVTLNGGAKMEAWYDIKGNVPRQQEEAAGIDMSAALVQSVIHLESQRLAKFGGSKRVVVGGFSQGAALAHAVAHTYPGELAGVVALSGYFTAKGYYQKHFETCNNKTPLYVGHGDQDAMVPLALAKDSYEVIMSMRGLGGAGTAVKNDAKSMMNPVGKEVEMHSFNMFRGMEHSSCPAEMQEVFRFIGTVVPPLDHTQKGM